MIKELYYFDPSKTFDQDPPCSKALSMHFHLTVSDEYKESSCVILPRVILKWFMIVSQKICYSMG